MTAPPKPLLILASASPRRKELLEQAGHEFQVCPAHLDETTYSAEGMTPAAHAEKLALTKAKCVAKKYPEAVVIGADTLVDLAGQIIGKPADAKDAERILKTLSRKSHKVITGLAIVRLSDDTEIVKSEITRIHPRPMTDEQIDALIKKGLWRGKSGACAIEDVADEFIRKIEGSTTNISGLPMELLLSTLKDIGLTAAVTRADSSDNAGKTGR